MKSLISCVEPLSFPFKCMDPFLFCVYHRDMYPPGDKNMQAPHPGDGADFNPNSAYRMYHGDRIPGFPQHPHRGFETITATLEGVIDHTDSMGNAGRYGHGDLQWMTAGKGIVHSEMFPLINAKKNNPTKFFQIWINLPSASKMVEPAFKMHWCEDIPVYKTDRVSLIIWAGSYLDQQALHPPPDSWASNDTSDVAIMHLTLSASGSFTLPASELGSAVNRMAYFVEGSSLSVGGKSVLTRSAVTLSAAEDALFENTGELGSAAVEVLILQGRPISEPIAQHGPFVMNTQSEVQQAFADYRRTKFGGWPWPQNGMVFPREKGRFALLDGHELRPPSSSCDDADDAMRTELR